MNTRTAIAGSADHRRALSVELKPVETLVASTGLVAVGRFSCQALHPLYRDSGPCSHHTIVFPRTATAVRRDDGSRFVADPTTVVFHNQGQQYTRSQVSDLDECDWFVVADELLFDVIANFDETAGDRHGRPFVTPFVHSGPSLYLAQRRLFEQAARGGPLDTLGIDEAVVDLLVAVVRQAQTRNVRKSGARRAKNAAERVEVVKRAIAQDVSVALPLVELALIAECSPFELCRSFREATGMRITEYRNALRTRLALGILRDGRTDLAQLALELGFSSHSHFTSKFRGEFGFPPSTWRFMG